MPKIIDFSYNDVPANTTAGIAIPMPSHSVGDLLVAFIVWDTATTWDGDSAWSGAGWSILFSRLQTSQFICLYKIAGSSEPASMTMASSANDTGVGTILAITDVDPDHPFGDPDPVLWEAGFANGANYSCNTITTTRDNSLVLYFGGNSGTLTTFCHNPVTQQVISGQGGNEGMAVAWYFQETAGVTPSGITTANPSVAGMAAVFQVQPPSTGATVFPTFISNDDCTYVSPLDGSGGMSGFPANTAIAQTADTNFGSTLNGVSVLDGTASSSANSGYNPERGALGLATPATGVPGTEYGVNLAFTSTPIDMDGGALLVHSIPASAVTTAKMSPFSTGLGVWLGMRSGTTAATNFKIWQILGSGHPLVSYPSLPVLLHPSAAATVTSAGTLAENDLTVIGFWLSPKTTSTTQHLFSSAWIIRNTYIVGGASTLPITTNTIVESLQARERNSVLLQGAREALLCQPLTIGNGGTNRTYLQIDGSAIEFPQQYSQADKATTCHVPNNFLGLKYYPGASDTIKHTNSIVTSRSRFHWGLHASASASATYDFNGLVIKGAGTITLNKAITVSGVTIDDFVEIDLSGATYTDSVLKGCPSANDSVTVTGSTTIEGCTINTSGVASGNRMVSVADPSIFSNCEFMGGGGHAIRITTAGTYSFVGNTGTDSGGGFDANGSDGAFFLNDSGGAVTINISGGDTPTYKNGSGASTTINNASTVTIEANVSLVGAEIRIYDLDDVTPPISYGTELSGTESHGSSTYQFSTDASNVVLIQIMLNNYVEFVQQYTVPSGSSTFTAILTKELNA